MKYPVNNLRNVCLLGHGGDGKTSLAEALLYYTDGIDRMGKTADGNTVCDYDPEEVARKISISSAVAPIVRNGVKLNIIDTPGYFDFEGEVIQALKASEFAIIVLSAKDGINVGTEKAVKLCAKYNVPAMFYISKMDEDNSNFHKVYTDLKATFGAKVCAINAPIYDDNGKNIGYVDLNDMTGKRFEKGKRIEIPIPASMNDMLENFKEGYREALAETSDEMMEKFFAGEEFTVEETKQGLAQGLETTPSFPLCPVLPSSSWVLSPFSTSWLTTSPPPRLLKPIPPQFTYSRPLPTPSLARCPSLRSLQVLLSPV
jgi:elongation factor G